METPAEDFDRPAASRKVRVGALRLSPTTLFVLALLVLVVTTIQAMRQPLRPDPHQAVSAFSRDWWLYPLEWNPPGRLARIGRELHAVHAVPGTETVYAVGDLGVIVVSGDGGQTWQTAASQTATPTPTPSPSSSPTPTTSPTPNLNPTPPTNTNTPRNFNDNSPGTPNSNANRSRAFLGLPDLLPTAHAAELHPPGVGALSPQGQAPPTLNTNTNINANTTITNADANTNLNTRATGQPPRVTASPQSNDPVATMYSPTAAPTPTVEGKTLSAVHFHNERQGFVVTDSGECFKTEDGGVSWSWKEATLVRPGRPGGAAVCEGGLAWIAYEDQPRPDSLIRLRASVPAERIARLVDDIVETIKKGDVIALAEVFFLDDGLRGWIIAEGSALWRTTGGGREWEVVDTNLPGRSYLRSIVFINESRGWVVGDRGEIFETADGGASWRQQPSGTEQNLNSVTFLPDGRRGWAVGAAGTVLYTGDGGETWIHQTQSERAGAATGSRYYFRLLPPWYYLSWVVVGLLLLPIRRTAVVDEKEEPDVSVADVLVSDRPLEEGDADTIGFNSIALGLSRFLRNENTSPPLTIAITGEWGTGKSSLMNLLRADLRKYDFRPVWFNAWHHQKEEHLLASLLQNVRLQAVPPWWRPEGLIFRSRLLRIRGARHWGPVLLLALFVAVAVFYELMRQDANTYLASYFKEVTSLFYGGRPPEVSGGVKDYLSRLPLLVSLLTFAGTVWRGATAFGVKPASLMASMSSGVRVRDLEAQTSFRQRFAAEFSDVTQALGARSMIIFIDDLDRCRPENVVETLEAVNFLVSSGECFVVIGMARGRVEPCVGLSFKDVAAEMFDEDAPPPAAPAGDAPPAQTAQAKQKRLDYARQYLDKLINIEVPVPLPSSKQSCDILVANTRRAEEHGDAPESPLQVFRSGVAALARGYWRTLLWAGSFLLLLSGCYALASFLARPVPLTNASPHQAAQPTPAITPAPTSSVTPMATASPAAGATPAPATTTATPTATPDARLPELTPGKRSVVLATVPVALALSLVLWVGVWLLTRRPGLVVKDSTDFVDALTIWHPLVFARSTTPRSIKRFMNRVRYLAMRQRPQSDSPPSWKRLLVGLETKSGDAAERKESPGPAAAPIRDELLVALAAIQNFKGRWLLHDTALLSLPSPVTTSMVLNLAGGTTADWDLLQEAKERHIQRFGGWDGDEVIAARQELLRMSEGVYVN